MKNLHHKATTKNYLKQKIWIGKKYTFYQEKFQCIQIFVFFSTKFWIIFSFLISYFSNLKMFHHHYVLFAMLHIFFTCNCTKQLWNELQYFVSQCRYIPEITPQSVLFGLFNIGNQQHNFLLINHLLLIFKYYLYMSREHRAACFTSLKLYLIKIKTVEQNISPCCSQKKEKCWRKWRVIEIFWNK